jgi:hypothetical protein
MLVILKLVEAGAGGGKEDDVAALGSVRGNFDCAFDSFRALDRYAAGDLIFDFFGGGADEQSENRFLS